MELKTIAEGIYYSAPEQELDQPCLYAVVGSDRALMIDGGVSSEKACQFLTALKALKVREPDFAVVTHWHWDHTFGLPGIPAPVFACAETAAHLRRMASYASWSDEALDGRVLSHEEIPMCAGHIKKVYPGALRGGISIRQPDVVFRGGIAFDLGGLTCVLEKLPYVHTDDSVSVFVPERGVLFIGDSTGQNSYDYPPHYSAPAVLELMDFIRGKNAAIIAESHTEPESPEEFWACNGILETAAKAVLGGINDFEGLRGRLARAGGGFEPDELDEIARLFVSGVGW